MGTLSVILAVTGLNVVASTPAQAISHGQNSATLDGQVQFYVSATGRIGDPNEFACGGTLIGVEWVLTAKHCVTETGATVNNSGFLIGDRRAGHGEPHTLESIHLEPNTDVALLQLEDRVSNTTWVESYGLGVPATNSNVAVRGWGAGGGGMRADLQVATMRVRDTRDPDGLEGARLSLDDIGQGFPEHGDSGGGVKAGSRVFAVLSAIDEDDPIAYAVPIEDVADWVQRVSGIGPSDVGASGQQVAVASYIHPLADSDAWNRLIASPSDKVSVLVANVLNGPDTRVNAGWKDVIDRAAASGKRVLGYVPTGYLGVSQQHFTTRLGSADLADWIAQIERDIDMWYELYGDKIGGIFFDEGWNDCGENNKYADLYRHLNQYAKRKHPTAMTVLNPGATMPRCFEYSADTLMTFESSYESYTGNYAPNDWTPSDPRKLWHIVYNVPEGEVGRVVELARQRGVGYIQVTDDVLPNPYDTLPRQSYWSAHLNAVSGGRPAVAEPDPYNSGAPPPTAPSALSVIRTDYTSATVSWTPGANAAAHQVYLDNQAAISVPAGMNRVTIGNLAPGHSNYTFKVTAQGASGAESAASNTASASTLALPNGKAVTNVTVSATAGSTTYKADLLTPYAFKRIYIWYSDQGCNWEVSPGWPVNYNQWNYVCATYMVEGTTLFKYSGKVDDSTTNAPWAWTPVGTAPVEVNGYTHTWSVPIGTSTARTTNFVIQAEGYGPTTNIFEPCPTLGAGPDGNGRYCA